MTHQSAPRTLTGSGYIFLYRFTPEFIRAYGNIPPFLQGKFKGGLGAVMLMDYVSSDVGAYRELLFIPGWFEVAGKLRYSITRIYVSTAVSVVNGRENWGIPKEYADFDVQQIDEQAEKICISQNGKPFFNATLITESVVRLPFNFKSAWIPMPKTLTQEYEGKTYLTTPRGHGRFQFAGVAHLRVNGECFPDISYLRPLAVVKLVDFRLTFPAPKIV